MYRLTAGPVGMVATCVLASASVNAQPEDTSPGGARLVRDVLADCSAFVSTGTISWLRVATSGARGDRTRPDGDPRAFPSDHASSTFATATVLQQHYGWRVGIAGYAAAHTRRPASLPTHIARFSPAASGDRIGFVFSALN